MMERKIRIDKRVIKPDLKIFLMPKLKEIKFSARKGIANKISELTGLIRMIIPKRKAKAGKYFSLMVAKRNDKA